MARVARALPPVRGRARAGMWMYQRLGSAAAAAPAPVTVHMRRGHRMRVPVSSRQTWRALASGRYDDHEIELLAPLVKPGCMVLDIGASLGFYTIPLGVMARDAGAQVVAIEPLADNCSILQANVDLNGLAEHVQIMCYALGESSDREAVFHVEAGGFGNAWAEPTSPAADLQVHDRAGRTHDRVVSQVHRLDELTVRWTRPCTAIKLDVEGLELDVLRGAERLVGDHRPAILGEFSPAWLSSRGIAPDAPLRWAQQHGYRCLELRPTRRHPLAEQHITRSEPLAEGAGRSGALLLLPEEGSKH
ncbi:MAG: FkbM family methyltransferase [Actinomycetota bacterium]